MGFVCNSRGLDLVFQQRPPLSDSSIPMSQTSAKEKFRLLSEKVQSLLLKRVMEKIPVIYVWTDYFFHIKFDT